MEGLRAVFSFLGAVFVLGAGVAPVQAAKFRARVISQVEEGTFVGRSLNRSNVWAGFVRSASGVETGYIGNSGLAIRTGTLGGESSWVNALSDGKWATGSSLDTNEVERAFLFWDGYMEDLSFFQPVGYEASAGMGIFEGTVTGWVVAPTGEKRAFTYSAGHFTVLPKFGVSSVGYAVEGSRVAGVSMSEAGVERGFIWRDFGPIYIPSEGSSSAVAMRNGRVVGHTELSGGEKVAYYHDEYANLMVKLGTLGGRNSKARGVNWLRRVVGEAEDAEGRRRAFYYRKGTMYDLNHLIDGREPVVLTSAIAINDSDSILAEGSYAGQVAQFFLELVEPFDDSWLIEAGSVWVDKEAPFYPTLRFFHSGPTGQRFAVQVSEDLKSWRDTGDTGDIYEQGNSSDLKEAMAATAPRRFYRLRKVE